MIKIEFLELESTSDKFPEQTSIVAGVNISMINDAKDDLLLNS